jgi:hypothetical protein
MQTSRPARSLLAVALAAGVLATAAPSGAADPLPPPPTGNFSGQGKGVVRFFSLYHRYAEDPDFCILSQRSARDAFKRHFELIPTLPPEEAKVFADYWNQHFFPYFGPHFDGVPGMGDYAALVARRKASMEWLKANFPKGPARTPDEIGRYAEAERVYLARVKADHEWVEQLFATSPCIRWAAKNNMEGGELYEFGIYRRSWVNDVEALAKVRAERAKLLPSVTVAGLGANALKRYGDDHAFKDSGDLGTALVELAGGVREIDADVDDVAALQVWIDKLGPEEGGELAKVLELRLALRARLVERFGALIQKMGLPAEEKDGAAAAQAKKLAGKGALVVRVTGKMTPIDFTTTDAGSGKRYVKPVRFVGKSFGFAVVAKGPPPNWDGWPKDLAAGLGDLCHVTSYFATYHTAGADVKLRTWNVTFGTAYPMLCARKTETFTP